jgi:hypothetical protein
MTCLLTNGSVFFHIPKTGGTWVYNILKKNGLVKARLGHVHADFFHAYWNHALHSPSKVLRIALTNVFGTASINGRMPENPHSFCFVREPLSWYESYWKFMQGLGWPVWGNESDPRDWHPCACLNGLGSDDFSLFLKGVVEKRPGFATELFGWYTKSKNTLVGRQEHLANDFLNILGQLGLSPGGDFKNNRKENVSKKPEKEIKWDPHLARDIVHLESAGYRRYQYCEKSALERVGA